ncbi:MAG: PDZ domain-containing protein [Planctomycetes bacterium]|nr:PDZ domain-containing protein [Planctomycetota bacterium]
MKKLLLLTFLIALVLSFSSVIAQEKLSFEDLVAKLLVTTDKKEQTALINKIVLIKRAPDDVANMLEKSRKFEKTEKTGWLSLKNKCIDGVTRPYHLYIPENYTPEKEYMMMFDLHGGISRPTVITEEMLVTRHQFWGGLAKKYEFILAIPTGQKNAEWWSDAGAYNVLNIIDYVKYNYNLNENKVFCSGFSDGASGSYYIAMAHNTPFAGFLPLNGHVAVAQVGGMQVQLPNLGNKPMYVINTGKDQLYPALKLKSIIELMKKAGAKIEYKVYDEYGHTPQYLLDKNEYELIYKWMLSKTRNPHPKKLIWEASESKYGHLHWLNILKIKDVGNNAKFEDYNLKMKPSRVIVGVLIEQEYYGIGVKIKEVQEKTLAEKMTLKAGDIIIGIDGNDIDGVDDLKIILSKKKFGDEIKIKILRGKEELEFSGKFPEAKEVEMLMRSKVYGSIKAESKGNTIDLKVKNIEKFELFISDKQFDVMKPITVFINGEKYLNEIIRPSIRFMLTQFCSDNDRKMIYFARLTITVKKAKSKPENKYKEEDF